MKKLLIAAALATTAIGGVALAAQMDDGGRPPHDRRGGAMAQADANHDGTITRDEFLAAATKRFDKVDANHDGKITPEERQAMRGHGMGGKHGGWRHGPGMDGPGGPGMEGPRGPGGPGMEGRGPGGGPEAMFAHLDANKDGKISREEFTAPMLARVTGHFDRMDANHDGFVDKAEMDGAHKQMRERMEHMRDRAGSPDADDAPAGAPQPNTGK
ncbi:EF-hand domain-containing protein [Sphingomonas sp. 28-63-12]|uniref:EF-hand domain-containing protein n=1 Tax=Sphingomonas sp. 28-63-12 TaxID=1970434 RepID=UPI0035A96316